MIRSRQKRGVAIHIVQTVAKPRPFVFPVFGQQAIFHFNQPIFINIIKCVTSRSGWHMVRNIYICLKDLGRPIAGQREDSGETMKVAVTVWEERISPVFDASRRLLVAEIQRQQIANRSYIVFDPGEPTRLAKSLAGMDVHVLICGAISQVPATLMTNAGITLIPFITGEVERVLVAYAKGSPLSPTFAMPGCKNITDGTHSSF